MSLSGKLKKDIEASVASKLLVICVDTLILLLKKRRLIRIVLF